MEVEFQFIVDRIHARQRQPDDSGYDLIAPDDGIEAGLEEINLEPLAITSTTSGHPDTLLVRAIQHGDVAAFETLFFKYQGQIYRTALAITRDPGSAEEVLQDCFYRTYLNIMNITGDGSLSPWLHRVAINLSCNAIKKRRVRMEPIEDVAEATFATDPHQSPEMSVERAELRSSMRDAINSLSLKHRIVVTLHYLEEFSLPEIAYILDLPLGTVKSRLHHARKELRGRIEAQSAVTLEPAYDPAF